MPSPFCWTQVEWEAAQQKFDVHVLQLSTQLGCSQITCLLSHMENTCVTVTGIFIV
jgi:hypothetical protein